MNLRGNKNFFPEDVPLWKIFKVDDLQPYETTFIANLNFSNRVQNQLRENNFSALSKLLTCTVGDIRNLRSIGNLSVNNIMDTLEDFFILRDSDARRKNSQIPPEIFVREEIMPPVKNLPENIKDRKFLLMVDAYNADIVNSQFSLSAKIPADLTIGDFPKFFIDNKVDFDRMILKNFTRWLDFDLDKLIESVLAIKSKDGRPLEVLKLRAEDNTLQMIGNKLNLTRERIRQIENRTIIRFHLRYKFKAEQLLLLLHAITEKTILTFDDMKHFVGEDTAVLMFLLSKTNFETKKLFYEPDTRSIVFHTPSKKNFYYTELAKNCPEIMHESEMEKIIKRVTKETGCYADLLRLRITQIYQREGAFYFRYRLPLVYKCGYVLREKFPHGYKISDTKDRDKLEKSIYEIFEGTEKFSHRSIALKVASAGVLCGRGKYIHPDYVNVPAEIIDLINNYVDNSDHEVLSFKEIFFALKDKFADTQIKDHYFLQGIMHYYRCPYTFFKDYVTKNPELNMSKELTRFVEKHGVVTAADIKAEFSTLNDTNINLLTPRCQDVIAVGEGKYMHSSLLNLRRKDFEVLEKTVREACKNYPVTSRYLFNLCKKTPYFQEFFRRNEIYRHEKLFGVIRHMFRYTFYFCRPFIALENITGITNKKVILCHIGDVDKISLDEIIGICEEQEINYLSKAALAESLRPEFVRVNDNELYRPAAVGIDEENIFAVVKKIRSALKKTEGWLSAKEFKDYKELPRLKVEWTDFLLESVISLAGDAIDKMRINANAAENPATVFVSKKFKETEIESFLTEILLDRQAKKPFKNKREVFKWMRSQGLCNTKLPNFLTEKHFAKDAAGKFVVK